MRAASASTWYLRYSTAGIVLPHDLRDLVPQHHRVGERVRLRRAGQQLARPRVGELEAVPQNPFDAVTREDAGLLRDLVRSCRRGCVRRRPRTRLRNSRGRTPCRCPPRRGWRAATSAPAAAASAAGSRTDRSAGEWRESAPPTRRRERLARRSRRDRSHRTSPGARSVLVHHPAVLLVELAAPGKLGERKRHVTAARGGLERGDAGRNDFAADAVAGDDRDLERLWHGRIVVSR